MPATAGLTFDQALETAEARAPELTAQRHAVAAADSARIAADSLPDPKLVLGVDNVPVDGPDAWNLDRDFMTMRRIGLMQDVPNTAKRRARADMAEAMAERERAMLTAEQAMVRRDAALAWLTRYYLERRLTLLDELERENQLLLKATQAQLRGGQGMAADTTMARQETAMLADRRDDLHRDLTRTKAMLRRWVGSAADDELAGDPPSFAIDPERLREHFDRHPELLVYEPMAAQAAAEVREAEAMKRPDWGVELAYQKRAPEFGDMAMLQVSFDLPLFRGSRQNPRIAAKRADEQRVVAQREAAWRMHAEELDGLLADHAALSRRLARMRDTMLPLAEEKVKLLLASYRAGRTGLTQTLGGRRELIEMRLKIIELETELSGVSARLVYLYPETHQ